MSRMVPVVLTAVVLGGPVWMNTAHAAQWHVSGSAGLSGLPDAYFGEVSFLGSAAAGLRWNSGTFIHSTGELRYTYLSGDLYSASSVLHPTAHVGSFLAGIELSGAGKPDYPQAFVTLTGGLSYVGYAVRSHSPYSRVPANEIAPTFSLTVGLQKLLPAASGAHGLRFSAQVTRFEAKQPFNAATLGAGFVF